MQLLDFGVCLSDEYITLFLFLVFVCVCLRHTLHAYVQEHHSGTEACENGGGGSAFCSHWCPRLRTGSAVLTFHLFLICVCVHVCKDPTPCPHHTHTQREQGQRQMQAALLRAVKLAVATLRIKQVVHSKRRAQLNDSQLIRIDAVQVFVRARAHALMHTQIWARNAVAHQHTSA